MEEVKREMARSKHCASQIFAALRLVEARQAADMVRVPLISEHNVAGEGEADAAVAIVPEAIRRWVALKSRPLMELFGVVMYVFCAQSEGDRDDNQGTWCFPGAVCWRPSAVQHARGYGEMGGWTSLYRGADSDLGPAAF